MDNSQSEAPWCVLQEGRPVPSFPSTMGLDDLSYFAFKKLNATAHRRFRKLVGANKYYPS